MSPKTNQCDLNQIAKNYLMHLGTYNASKKVDALEPLWCRYEGVKCVKVGPTEESVYDPNINAAFFGEGCLSPPRGLGSAPHDGKAVHRHSNDTWWFWDETWMSEYGPYPTEEEANQAVNRYAAEL